MLGQWDEPAHLAASSRQQLAPKRGQPSKPPAGVPRPPGRVPGPPATILGVLLRLLCAFSACGGAFVGQFGPQTAPNTEGLRALGWASGGSGGRALGQNPLRQRAGCLLLVFRFVPDVLGGRLPAPPCPSLPPCEHWSWVRCIAYTPHLGLGCVTQEQTCGVGGAGLCPSVPCQRCGAIWPPNGPKWPQTAPDGPRTCAGVWWPYLGTECTCAATCGLPFGHVRLFLSCQGCGLAPKRVWKWPKSIFSKYDPTIWGAEKHVFGLF